LTTQPFVLIEHLIQPVACLKDDRIGKASIFDKFVQMFSQLLDTAQELCQLDFQDRQLLSFVGTFKIWGILAVYTKVCHLYIPHF
jgi:hypothetical protein